MSLEQALKENTEAVRELSSIMQSRSGNDAQQKARRGDNKKPDPKAKAEPKAKAKAKAAPKAKAKAKANKSKYARQQVADKLLSVANKYGREHAKAVLEELDVKTVKDLDEEQFEEAMGLLAAKAEECAELAGADEDDFEEEDGDDFEEEDGDEEDFDD